MTPSEGRDALRYDMLVVLDASSTPIDYRETLPGVDFFELRGAASWLVEHGYALWSGGGVAITDLGRRLAASLQPPDGRHADH